MQEIIFLCFLYLLGEFYIPFALQRVKCFKNLYSANISNKRMLLKALLNSASVLIMLLFILVSLDLNEWYILVSGIVAITITNFILDFLFEYVVQKNNNIKKSILFVIKQIVIIVAIYLFSYFGKINFGNWNPLNKVIYIITVILAMIIPSCQLVGFILKDTFIEDLDSFNENASDMVPKKFDSGAVIGTLERIIIIMMALYNALAAIAIVITIKTWARKTELEQKNFGNKYLVGTLSSIVLALIAAAILDYLL